jgi:putative MATE family efflux protein
MEEQEDKKPENRQRKVKDWTRGNIFKNLMSISWPIIVSQSVTMVGPTIDMIWVGKLGPDAIAAVGVSGMVVMFIMTVMMGVAIGARALIARFIGMKRVLDAVRVARQAFMIGFAFAIFIALIGIISSSAILRLLGVDGEVLRLGSAYLRVQFGGALMFSSWMITENIMQSSGDTITPLWIGIISKIVHVILCPFLIFGLFFFPEMGVVGAAVANIVSQGTGLAVGLRVLFTGKTRLHLHLKGTRIDPPLMWRIIRIGVPGIVMLAQKNLSNLIVMRIIITYGTLAVAAHTVLQRVEMIFFMAGVGMGAAAGVLAGQNLGARQPDRAAKSGIYAFFTAETFVIICCTLAFIFPEPIISIFTRDPELIKLTTVFLRIGVVGYLMCGIEPVFMQFFTGVGDTFVPMTFEVSATWFVLLPLALLLPNLWDLEVYGVRWAMALSMVLLTSGYVTYFFMGKWKGKEV